MSNNVDNDNDAYKKSLEEFLYQVIARENTNNNRWELLNAACTPSERAMLDAEQRRVATNCPKSSTGQTTTTTTRTSDNENIITEEDTGEKYAVLATCCSFYDPNMKPFVRRRRRSSDDDD
jgi:hypothetical protein